MTIEAELEEFDRPVSAELPCGENLEDTQLMASFDAFHLFGQAVPLAEDKDWRLIRAQSLEGIRKSKDIRLLAHFSAATLRIDGWVGFCGALHTAASWIKTHWATVYPLVDEDAILRKNALTCLSDRMAILDAVRRAPIVENRQLGRISLRDVELATGQLAPSEKDTSPATQSQISAVFAAEALPNLQSFKALMQNAIGDLRAIDAAMREFGGTAASPDFDPLLSLLAKVDKLVTDELTLRGANEAVPGEAAPGGAAAGGGSLGVIKSRQDATRALDAIAAFFKSTEPSSPVPLFIERAKRLIGKDFLEILSDVAPDGVASAKHAGGLTE